MSTRDSSEEATASDRPIRLRCARDPNTPVEVLLGLASEFPDQVAANPVLPSALASQPACITSATDVALACLMTSPSLPASVSGVLDSLIMNHATASLESASAAAAEFVRFWRAAGARKVLVDVSAPRNATAGLHNGFEQATRGRVILAARLGIESFACFGNEKNGEDSEFDASRASVGTAARWPAVLLPKPPDGNYAFSRRCAWDSAQGEAVVELADYPGNASALICVPRDGEISATVYFDHLRINDWWEHPISEGGMAAVRQAVQSLCESAGAVPPGDLVVASCARSEVTYDSVDVGVISQAFLEEYLAEGEDILGDAIEEGDGETPATANAGAMLSLIKRASPTEFGFALDGGKSSGPYEDFVARMRPIRLAGPHASLWRPSFAESLFKSIVPAAELQWADGGLRRESGSMDDLPLFVVALADRSGDAAIAMMHFLYADGWGKWRILTDPLRETA